MLALQGGFEAHARLLARLGHEVALVRGAADLAGQDGLVLPGGESSTQLVLLARTGLWDPLDRFVRAGRPVLCTCAGLVLAARRVTGPSQRSFGWLGVEVARNAWGPQVDSFEARDDAGALPLVFIRAPRIVAVDRGTEVVATLRAEPILVRQGALWGAAFHPELTDDETVHREVFAAGRATAAPRARCGCSRGGTPPSTGDPATSCR